ncbi:MAG TPA: SH3 domain-containing protein [Tepidisphaeraceae bacterium]|nr:SH3 domain-containing protein [Tepidisphaeraceae bacterium]
MAARRIFLAGAVSFFLVAPLLPTAVGVPAAVPTAGDVENAKHNFIGVINGNGVYVKSAPREDAYPAMKLDKGAKVTVVGIKFKWLKVLPPDGSFAYVPKAYVIRRDKGNVGRVNRETLAKVGSAITPVKTAPMAKLEDGQDVEILGEQDEYYKIKPPQGSFLYVNQGFVDKVGLADPAPDSPGGTIAQSGAGRSTAGAGRSTTGSPRVATGPRSSAGPSTQDTPLTTRTPGPDDIAAAPAATQPAEASANAAAMYEKLEADFKSANGRSITDQPVDTLLAGYQDLLKQDALDGLMRKVAESRVSTLKLRSEAKGEFLALEEAEKKQAEQQQAMVAERAEIEKQIKDHALITYTAIGTLRTSSLQRGPTTLYRLTDPATGRTVAYLRTNDAKYATLLGQFIGIKGTVTTDATLNMKVVEQPTQATSVDPAKVNTKITAQILPPSLIGNIRSASTAD